MVDPGCLSRILIFTHLGSWIPDPKTVTREVKKICYHTFFCSHKFHKIEYHVIFEMLKKKIWANFQRIVEVFTQKIFNMLSNIWVWDPRSGIRKKPIPDPVVEKAPDPQHCIKKMLFIGIFLTFFHVKNQLFVSLKSDHDPDPDPHISAFIIF